MKQILPTGDTKTEAEQKRKIIVAMRILPANHPCVEAWVATYVTTDYIHAVAMQDRKASEQRYPDAKFQLGDAVRYEQNLNYYRGFISEINICEGVYIYTIIFIVGETPIVYEDGKPPRSLKACETLRINEADLQVWGITPIA